MDSSNRLFRFSKPSLLHTPPARTFGVYMSGALFSLALFFIIDAAAYSHSALNGSAIHIKFIDWVPGICSALGMLVINLIEKSRLSADSYSYNGSGVAWKARLVLFLGFALLAGGLAGSVVSTSFASSLLYLTSIKVVERDCFGKTQAKGHGTMRSPTMRNGVFIASTRAFADTLSFSGRPRPQISPLSF